MTRYEDVKNDQVPLNVSLADLREMSVCIAGMKHYINSVMRKGENRDMWIREVAVADVQMRKMEDQIIRALSK